MVSNRKTKANAVRTIAPEAPAKRVYTVSAKRVAKRDKRRSELLLEAMALTVEEGLDALTIAGLAKRVGSSVGALYRYFPSKEVILAGLQELAIRDYHEFALARLAAFDAGQTAAGTTPVTAGSAQALSLARLLVALRSYLEHGVANPRAHRLVDAVVSDPEPVLRLEDAIDIDQRVVLPILGVFGELFEAAARVGALAPGDAGQRTYVAWALQHGLDHFKKRDRVVASKLRTGVLQGVSLRALLAGFGASAAALDAAEAMVAAVPRT